MKMDDFIIEKKGNLFDATDSLCHCVSRDMNMGKGIAVTFKSLFGDLKYQNKKVGEVAILSSGDRFIYYLVTKERYFHKPTYESLEMSLINMKIHCLENKITALSMPRIGCGLDRLEWDKVKDLLIKVFTLTNIIITIYYL